jgi:site-specific DNA recombinase
MLIGSLFTDKLILGNECCRTTNINEVINVLTRKSKGLEGAKKGKAVKNDSLSVYVPGVGIEPTHLSTRV